MNVMGRTPDEIRAMSLDRFAVHAASINDSAPLMAIYAAPEWDCLNDDGKLWICGLIRETLARAAAANEA